MDPIIFKTTNMISKFWLIVFLLVAVILILLYDNFSGFFYVLLSAPLIYFNSLRKYTITETSFIVKEGFSKSNYIPWYSICHVTLFKGKQGKIKALRIDYQKPDGKSGFYVIVGKEVDVSSVFKELQERCPQSAF